MHFAMLSPAELEVFRFYRDHGRKFGVAVSIIGDVDAEELARAASRQHAEEILRRSRGKVYVKVQQR